MAGNDLIAGSTTAGAAQIGRVGVRYLRTVVLTPAAADATLELFDGEADTAPLRLTLKAQANSPSIIAEFHGGLFSKGIYAKPAGAGALYSVEAG